MLKSRTFKFGLLPNTAAEVTFYPLDGYEFVDEDQLSGLFFELQQDLSKFWEQLEDDHRKIQKLTFEYRSGDYQLVEYQSTRKYKVGQNRESRHNLALAILTYGENGNLHSYCERCLVTQDQLFRTEAELLPTGNTFWERTRDTYRQYLRFKEQLEKHVRMRRDFTDAVNLWARSKLRKDEFRYDQLYLKWSYRMSVDVWWLKSQHITAGTLSEKNYMRLLLCLFSKHYQFEYRLEDGYLELEQGDRKEKHPIEYQGQIMPLTINFLDRPNNKAEIVKQLQAARVLMIREELFSAVSKLDQAIKEINS